MADAGNALPYSLSLRGKMLKIPASLRRFAKYIEDIEDYRDQGPGGDGYWIHLKKGYINAPYEVHHIHEDNITQCIPKFSGVVPCNCEQCRE